MGLIEPDVSIDEGQIVIRNPNGGLVFAYSYLPKRECGYFLLRVSCEIKGYSVHLEGASPRAMIEDGCRKIGVKCPDIWDELRALTCTSPPSLACTSPSSRPGLTTSSPGTLDRLDSTSA